MATYSERHVGAGLPAVAAVDVSSKPAPPPQGGMALIEAILFLVIVGVAAGAVLSLFAGSSQRSAELLVHRQALAVAQALLAEVRSAPFTFCDPDVPTYASPTCVAPREDLVPGGAEPGETRLGAVTRLDNVSDYRNLAIGPGITSLNGTPMPGLAAYSAQVTVAPVAPAGNWNGVPASEVALVSVTVTAPMLPAPLVLQGLRTRHAPGRI
ncbi:MAG: type II secretion system protein [Betaproteobacteria bacterium]|nr:type II secretion system protein [Betaproteobacteria bacterium]